MDSSPLLHRSRRLLAAGLLALAILAGARLHAAELSDGDRLLRLTRAPITLYPDYNVGGTPLAAVINRVAGPADAVVVSYTDALKGRFRTTDLGMKDAQVWVYVTGYADFVNTYRRQAEGMRGVVYIPNPARKPEDWFQLTKNTENYRADAAKLGARVIVGVEYREHLKLSNVHDLAANADIYTIYANQLLRARPQRYREYISRLAKEARAANPRIKIEVAISTGETAAATQAMAGVIWANADLLDRIGIYCNDTPASTASVETYFKVFRPQGKS